MIARLCGERAANLQQARDLCCAEALLTTLARAFGNEELPESTAVRLGSGFCKGMGGAGCLCGALAGAQMFNGLLLGPFCQQGLAKKDFQPLARRLHDDFKERFGATCCRSLLKRRKEKQGASCPELTAGAAELAAAQILDHRPELAAGVDLEFLQQREEPPKKQ
ncbi:MAG: C-GCAxxG-C-C family protein [Desulfurivibrio sp.]|nr:C-GCAxxG-C-C family protein [Desulfurivibrio sp.]